MNREQTEQEVAHLAEAWANAELRGDTTFLAHILADDYIGIGPLGFMLTKWEWIARHQTGDLKYEAFTLDEVKGRVFSDAVILIGRQAQHVTYRGTSISAQFRVTLVFVHQHGQWQLANLQLSSIDQPPHFTQA